MMKKSSTKKESKGVAKKLSRMSKATAVINVWTEERTCLVKNRAQLEAKRKMKVAAFDLDGTLIKTKSGIL